MQVLHMLFHKLVLRYTRTVAGVKSGRKTVEKERIFFQFFTRFNFCKMEAVDKNIGLEPFDYIHYSLV